MLPLVRSDERKRLARKARRDRWYSLFRVPMRPRLTGNHFSLWRCDFERIDGFDQGFRGWGLEDCDLQRRLAQVGIRCRSVLPEAVGFHLWHPTDPSFVRKARGTANEAYYREPFRRDGRARSGLSTVDRRAMALWRWREGKLDRAAAMGRSGVEYAPMPEIDDSKSPRSTRFIVWLATGFGVGRWCPAPGTAGAAMGVILAWGISLLPRLEFQVLAIVALERDWRSALHRGRSGARR